MGSSLQSNPRVSSCPTLALAIPQHHHSLGALAIPSVFAHLGWLAAGVALLALGLAMLFSGSLFTRLAAAHPDVSVYHRLAGAAYGRRGRWLVFGTVYTLILLSPAVIHLTSAEALGVLMGGRAGPSPGLLVTLAMLPLAQVRSMEDVGWVSVVGTGTMLAAVAVTLGKLLLEPLPERAAAATHWLPPASTTPRLALVALLDVVFAYGGQQARTWLGVVWWMPDGGSLRRAVSGVLVATAHFELGWRWNT